MLWGLVYNCIAFYIEIIKTACLNVSFLYKMLSLHTQTQSSQSDEAIKVLYYSCFLMNMLAIRGPSWVMALIRVTAWLVRGTAEGGVFKQDWGCWWLMWQVSSSIYTTLGCVVHLGVSTSAGLSACGNLLWRQGLKEGKGGGGQESILWNGKSTFPQIETDGQGLTLRPGHLTGTNGCTRLPVLTGPSLPKSPFQIESAAEK